MADKKEQLKALEEDIRRHRRLYYNEQPELSDAEFDELLDKLKELDPHSEALA